jgi:hypothetical protein
MVRYHVGSQAPSGSITPSGDSPVYMLMTLNDMALGDFNNDGRVDVGLASYAGDKLFTYVANTITPGGLSGALLFPYGKVALVATGDFNGDGNLDILGSSTENDNFASLLGIGNGDFNYGTGIFTEDPTFIVSSDFNNDGLGDAAILSHANDNVEIWLGNGLGSFVLHDSYVAGTGPERAHPGDFDKDGFVDLAITNGTDDKVTVLKGDGLGGFTPFAASPLSAGSHPRGVALGDMNEDGNLDITVTNWGGQTVSLFLGDGAGGFSAAAGSPFTVGLAPRSVAIGDLNGDYHLDIVVANEDDDNVTVLRGDGSGGFTSAPGSPFALGHSPIAVGIGDVDGDDTIDFLAASADAYVSVFLNP